MSEPQKKIIPKFKKQLQGFLSDESGKITKEDVLKMGMVAMGVSGVTTDTNAGHNSVAATCNHGNSYGLGGSSVGTIGSIQSNPWSRVINGHTNSAVGVIGIQGSPGHSNGQFADHTNSVTHCSHASHGSHCSGVCNCWSDERLKMNIEKMNISPSQLAGLNAYTYDFVSTEYANNSTNVGFLASEVESIFPHLITEKSGLKQVNYLGMIPILLESIKSLQMEVDLLKKISTQNA